MEDLVKELVESDGFDQETIDEKPKKLLRGFKMMKTYLGDEPDTQEALEFLCLAEGAEVTHYEVLNSVSKDVKIRSSGQNKIDPQGRKGHLDLCTKLATDNAASA